MKTNFVRSLFAVCVAAVAFSSCSSGSGSIGMGSVDAVAKVKEVVKANVDSSLYKIYRLEWSEGGGNEKLNNVLSKIEVYYMDKEGDDYDMVMELDGGEFVPQEPRKSKLTNYYSYELSTPLDVDGLDAENIRKLLTRGAEMVLEQEGEDEYELKSVNNVELSIDPVLKNHEKNWAKWDDKYKAKYKKVNQEFELNFTKKGEQDQVVGKRIVTNYYTIPFVVNEAGEVEFKK